MIRAAVGTVIGLAVFLVLLEVARPAEAWMRRAMKSVPMPKQCYRVGW